MKRVPKINFFDFSNHWKILLAFLLMVGMAALCHADTSQGGSVLRFNGTNCVTIPTTFGLTSNGTLECWVYLSSTNESGTFINVGGGGSGFAIGVGSGWFDATGNDLIALYDMNRWISPSPAAPMGTGWHHVAMVLTNGGCTLYLDGKKVHADGGSSPIVAAGSTFVGSSATNSRFLSNGDIDEVRIWSVGRTEAQIKAHMHRELAGDEPGLVAYYRMNEGSGTTLTNAVGGNNGTLFNGPQWKLSGCFAGPRQALNLNGGTQMVNVPTLFFTNQTAFTYETWFNATAFNPPADANIANLVGDDNTKALLRIGDASGVMNTNDRLQFVLFGTDRVNSPTKLQAGRWYHTAAVYDGATAKIYLDGVLDTSLAVTGLISFSAGTFRVGGASGARELNGRLDEVRVWHRALSETEIRENMMRALAGIENGLALYYRMDQTDGTTLYDNSTNAHNGTLIGSPTWPASTAFNTWLGGESATWSTSANWSRNSAPAAGHHVGLYKWGNLGAEATLSGTPSLGMLTVSSNAAPTFAASFGASGNVFVNNDATFPAAPFTNSPGVLAVAPDKTLTLPDGGALLVNSRTEGNVVIASGATLGGNRLLDGNATLQGGAILKPGAADATVGTLTNSGNMTVSGALAYTYERNATTGDLVRVGGTLDFQPGNALTVTLADLGGASFAGDLPIFTAATLSGTPSVAFDYGVTGLNAFHHFVNNHTLYIYRMTLSAPTGPFIGGNSLIVTGHFGAVTITNVLVGGVDASGVSFNATTVSFTVPTVGSSGVKDIVIQTEDGDLPLAAAYTVNPAGSITNVALLGFLDRRLSGRHHRHEPVQWWRWRCDARHAGRDDGHCAKCVRLDPDRRGRRSFQPRTRHRRRGRRFDRLWDNR